MGLDFGYPKHHPGGMHNDIKFEASTDLSPAGWEPLHPEFVDPAVPYAISRWGQTFVVCVFRKGKLVPSGVPTTRRNKALRVWVRIAGGASLAGLV